MADLETRIADLLSGRHHEIERFGEVDIVFDGEHLARVEVFTGDDFFEKEEVRERLDLFRTSSRKYVVGQSGSRWTSQARVLETPEAGLEDLRDSDGLLWPPQKMLLKEAGRRDTRIRAISRLELLGDHTRKLAEAVPRASIAITSAELQEHVERINESIDNDPSQAIGSAKDLVETVAKKVLDLYREDPQKHRDLAPLVSEALRLLNLSADNIPDSSKGASSSKRVLAGLNQIVGGVAELRNLYGTGHGRLRKGGPSARHARLVVGAASTLCRFMLETLDERIGQTNHLTHPPDRKKS